MTPRCWRVAHVSEERNVPAPPDVLWRLLADSRRWPEFYRTHDSRGVLTAVESVDGPLDAVGARRRLRWTLGDWEEQLVRAEAPERLEWHGVATPGFSRWQVMIELVPGRGFTTVRWDVFLKASGFFGRKARVAAVEDAVLTALLELDRLAMATLAGKA